MRGEGLKLHQIADYYGCNECSVSAALSRERQRSQHALRSAEAKLYDGQFLDESEPRARTLEALGYLRRVISYNPKHYIGRPREPRYLLVATEA